MDGSLVIFFGLVGVLTLCEATPLDDYVNKPDPSYSYTVIDKIRGPTYTFYTVNMTSQTWKPSKNLFSNYKLSAHFLRICYVNTYNYIKYFMCSYVVQNESKDSV